MTGEHYCHGAKNYYASQMPHMPSSSCAHMRQLCHYIHPYELNAIKNMTTSTGIQTFHIIGICPWYIYVPPN